MSQNLATEEQLEKTVWLFGGSLDELHTITSERYKIAGTFFKSESYYYKYLEYKVRPDLLEQGYDGIIHRIDHLDRGLHSLFLDFQFITGVPIKRVKKNEEESSEEK